MQSFCQSQQKDGHLSVKQNCRARIKKIQSREEGEDLHKISNGTQIRLFHSRYFPTYLGRQ